VAGLARKASMPFRPGAQADQGFSAAARASGVTPEAARAVPVESPTTALDLAGQGSPLQRYVRQAWNVPGSTAQKSLGKFRNVEHLPRPATMCHVQQERPRRICDIDRPFSREAKAHIIFWKHDRADAIPLFWLIFPNPQELGNSEIRQGWIRGKLN